MTVNEILNMKEEGCPSIEATLPEEIMPAPVTLTELRPMSLEELRGMPRKEAKAYIMALRERFNTSNADLSRMLGTSPKNCSAVCRKLGCPTMTSSAHYTTRVDEFYAWIKAYNYQLPGTLAERTRAVRTPIPPAPSPAQANSITYHGALADAAVMLAAMGNADQGIRHITITWS